MEIGEKSYRIPAEPEEKSWVGFRFRLAGHPISGINVQFTDPEGTTHVRSSDDTGECCVVDIRAGIGRLGGHRGR